MEESLENTVEQFKNIPGKAGDAQLRLSLPMPAPVSMFISLCGELTVEI